MKWHLADKSWSRNPWRSRRPAVSAATQLPRPGRIWLVVFFVSGFVSLVYQVVWQKVLSQTIGVDAYSVAIIVGVFMAGLGLGAIAGSTFARTNLDLVKIYVAMEAALGTFGIISVQALRMTGSLLSGIGGGYATDFVASFLLLLVPTLLMGMSLPLVVHILRYEYEIGKTVAVVYSAYIIGAALGALVAGFILAGTIGMENTCRIMGGLNFLLAVVVWRRGSAIVAAYEQEEEKGLEGRLPSTAQRFVLTKVLILSLISGFVALSYEIIFFRIFTAYFGATSYVFPLMIFSYLVALAVGTCIFGTLSDRVSLLKLFIALPAFTVITTLIILYGQQLLFALGLRQDFLAMWPHPTWVAIVQLPAIGVTALLLLIPVVFISGYFPLIVRLATPSRDLLGVKVGMIYFTQTAGNCCGVLVTALFLLPSIGTVASLRLLGVIQAFLPVVLLWGGVRSAPGLISAIAVMAVAGVGVVLYPGNFYDSFRYYQGFQGIEPQQPVAVRESALGVTLAYPRGEDRRLSVFLGREFTTSILRESPRGQDCFPWEWVGALRDFHPARALVIGLGPSVGPFCLQEIFPGIAIDIVELNPDLVSLTREHSPPEVVHVLESTSVALADGRRFVQRQRSGSGTYDIMQVGVNNATGAGSGNVFSREFFRTLRDQLSGNGVLVFNAYPAVAKAGLDAFENLIILSPGTEAISHVLASKDVSTTGATQMFDPERFRAVRGRLNATSKVRVRDDWVSNGCVISREEVTNLLSGLPTATDDLPATEYYLTNRQYVYSWDWRSYKPRDYRIFECDNRTTSLARIIGSHGRQ